MSDTPIYEMVRRLLDEHGTRLTRGSVAREIAPGWSAPVTRSVTDPAGGRHRRAHG